MPNCISDDGETHEHCFHEALKGDAHFQNDVCCWCGDIFIGRTRESTCGPYVPTLSLDALHMLIVEAKERRASRVRGKRPVHPPKSRK